MTATQVLAPVEVSEGVRTVLGACRRERTAGDYAHRLIDSLVELTHSQYGLWLNLPASPGQVVAETDGLNPLTRCSIIEEDLPFFQNDCCLGDGIHSVAAAPICFRSSVVGMLVVANSTRAYTSADLDLLEAIGRVAVAEHESLLCTEALGIANNQQKLAELAHALRQPLGILEACAYLLEMSLPDAESRARGHIAMLHRQLDRASRILDRSTKSYTPVRLRPSTGEMEPEESDSRFLTKSAMSMVT
jgi:GAF domain-containing protein